MLNYWYQQKSYRWKSKNLVLFYVFFKTINFLVKNFSTSFQLFFEIIIVLFKINKKKTVFAESNFSYHYFFRSNICVVTVQLRMKSRSMVMSQIL